MKLAVYAHPFDLEALEGRGGLSRLADLGIGEVALATSYHAGRWLQPWHPRARVRFLEDGTVHFRPGAGYGKVRPLASSAVAATGRSPLERCCAAAERAGVKTRAWTVLTHNSRLGEQHPELCIENAFGDRYRYGLCPAQPEVQRYVLELLRDQAGHPGLQTIELEAFGWLGWKHGSHHDKSSFQPAGLLDQALSLCFCDACSSAAIAAGRDLQPARRWAREVIRHALEDGDAMAPEPVPAAGEVLTAAHENRVAILRELGGQALGLLPPAMAAAMQVHPTSTFTGSQLPATQAVGVMADEYVITAYGEGPEGIGRLLAGADLQQLEGKAQRLSIWPKAPQFTSDEDLAKVRELCSRHGIAALSIYHLGLLPWSTLERVARFFAS